MTLQVRPVREERELAAALALRHEVFVGEQNVPPEIEADADDAAALHVVALDEDVVVGVCRVLGPDDDHAARVGRLCVGRGDRGKGIGSALLREAEACAAAAGASRMTMHAQLAAAALYRSLGYEQLGEIYEEAGIEHITMEKRLV